MSSFARNNRPPSRETRVQLPRITQPKSPTLHKLTELREVMEVHPLTLLTLAYAGDSTRKADQLLAQVRRELEAVLKERDSQ